MTCTHTLTAQSFGHRCNCCNRMAADPNQSCPDCRRPDVTMPKPVDLTFATENASAGVCMFCTAPASRQFIGDSSTRICERCVKG